MFEKFKFFRISPVDIAGVIRVQERAYLPFFHENAESFVSKMKLSPATCYGVLNEGRLVAYGISFPWFKSQGVDLNSTLTENSVKPDLMYIHDISVDPDYRGLGLGEALFKRILEDTLSKGLNELALVAVQGSKTFWSRFGFTITDSEVKGYGPDAVTMVLKL
jgi:GNAT superfamily N-acetyltransferase